MKNDQDDIEREIRTHLELEAEERVAEGLSETDARYAALRAFGNVTRIQEDVRAIYLGTHSVVRSTHASALPARGNAPELGALDEDLGEPTTLLIAVTVVAIAAIIGTAWYFTRRSAIEVEGRNVRTTAVAAEVARIAQEQLARTGKIDPGVWSVFKSIVDAEANPWLRRLWRELGGLSIDSLGLAGAGSVGLFILPCSPTLVGSEVMFAIIGADGTPRPAKLASLGDSLRPHQR